MQMQAGNECLFPNSLNTLLLARHGRIPQILRLRTIHWVDGLCNGVLVSGMEKPCLCCLAKGIDFGKSCETRSALWGGEIRQGNAKQLCRAAGRSI